MVNKEKTSQLLSLDSKNPVCSKDPVRRQGKTWILHRQVLRNPPIRYDIWSIFVYLSLINIVSVGYIGSLLAVSSAIFTLVMGRMADKRNKTKMIKIIAFFISIIWFLRYSLNNEIAFYALTIFAGIFFVSLSIPYYSIFYQIA
ncbi:MAG: hypothetical protein GF347_03380 [Candidatus Moranbacteria bacterium]|nr:hypothetical protein [Candidatus Moranbacteria bacterium]